jgi:transposase
MAERKILTDEQWAKIQPLLPKFKRSRKGGRRPVGNRPVFEGILWILRTGIRQKDFSLHSLKNSRGSMFKPRLCRVPMVAIEQAAKPLAAFDRTITRWVSLGFHRPAVIQALVWPLV